MRRLATVLTGLLVALLLPTTGASRLGGYTPEAEDDLVDSLPGAENLAVKFKEFSGYLDVSHRNATEGIYLHYWFVESSNSPETDPVVLWTNGGPGCSGLLGFFTEQGPYRPNKDGSLKLNDYSWNKIANMLFIEAPVGVGFSYADNDEDYDANDWNTARHNYRLLLGFFSRFPQYLKNELYIASESYGGHYMPTLTNTILREQVDADVKLNFKGFLVGNPFTSFINNNQAMYEAFWGKQLVSLPTYNLWKFTCSHIKDNVEYLDACLALELEMQKEIGNLNPYALDYPVCNEDPVAARGRAQRTWFLHHVLPKQLKSQKGVGIDVAHYEPCADNYLVKYLNRDDVKAAIHVKGDIKWTECSRITRYHQRDMMVPMEPLYHKFLDNDLGLKILVFSGDDDSVCATWGSQEWIFGLGYKITGARWKQWTDANNQVAGYVTQFERNFTFATVHGAGHEVPTYTPQAALELFEAYLNGTWFDLHHF